MWGNPQPKKFIYIKPIGASLAKGSTCGSCRDILCLAVSDKTARKSSKSTVNSHITDVVESKLKLIKENYKVLSQHDFVVLTNQKKKKPGRWIIAIRCRIFPSSENRSGL